MYIVHRLDFEIVSVLCGEPSFIFLAPSRLERNACFCITVALTWREISLSRHWPTPPRASSPSKPVTAARDAWLEKSFTSGSSGGGGNAGTAGMRTAFGEHYGRESDISIRIVFPFDFDVKATTPRPQPNR